MASRSVYPPDNGNAVTSGSPDANPPKMFRNGTKGTSRYQRAKAILIPYAPSAFSACDTFQFVYEP